MPNSPVFKCYLGTGQPNHLNTRQMDAILFSYVVRYSNGLSNFYLNFQIKIKQLLSSKFGKRSNCKKLSIQMFLAF